MGACKYLGIAIALLLPLAQGQSRSRPPRPPRPPLGPEAPLSQLDSPPGPSWQQGPRAPWHAGLPPAYAAGSGGLPPSPPPPWWQPSPLQPPPPGSAGSDCINDAGGGAAGGAGEGGNQAQSGEVNWGILSYFTRDALFSALANVALHKPTYASSRLSAETSSSRAVDGFIQDITSPPPPPPVYGDAPPPPPPPQIPAWESPYTPPPSAASQQFFSTASESVYGNNPGGWWAVDLQEEHFVFFVVLYNRYMQYSPDGSYQDGSLYNSEVRVGNAPIKSCGTAPLQANPLCWKQTPDFISSTRATDAVRAQCGSVMAGRWVSVQNEVQTWQWVRRPFNLVEVEVYGFPTTTRPGPPVTPEGAPLYNVAQRAQTFSSSYISRTYDKKLVAHTSRAAVDGIIPGISPGAPIETPINEANIRLEAASMFASQPEKYPWLSLYLAENHVVHHVLLYGRWDQRATGYSSDGVVYYRRLRAVEIRVGDSPVDTCGMGGEDLRRNELCWRQAEPLRYPGQVLRAECARPLQGRWVTVAQEAPPPSPYPGSEFNGLYYGPPLSWLELLEVEVYGHWMPVRPQGEPPGGASVPPRTAFPESPSPPRRSPTPPAYGSGASGGGTYGPLGPAPAPASVPGPDSATNGADGASGTGAGTGSGNDTDPSRPVLTTRCSVVLYGNADAQNPAVQYALVECEGPEAPVEISVGPLLLPFLNAFQGVRLRDPGVSGVGRPGWNDPWDCGITFHNLTRIELYNSVVQGLWLNFGGPLLHFDGAVDFTMRAALIQNVMGSPAPMASPPPSWWPSWGATPPPSPPPPDPNSSGFSFFSWRPINNTGSGAGLLPAYGVVLVERALLARVEEVACSGVAGGGNWACIWIDILEVLESPPVPYVPPPSWTPPWTGPSQSPPPPSPQHSQAPPGYGTPAPSPSTRRPPPGSHDYRDYHNGYDDYGSYGHSTPPYHGGPPLPPSYGGYDYYDYGNPNSDNYYTEGDGYGNGDGGDSGGDGDSDGDPDSAEPSVHSSPSSPSPPSTWGAPNTQPPPAPPPPPVLPAAWQLYNKLVTDSPSFPRVLIQRCFITNNEVGAPFSGSEQWYYNSITYDGSYTWSSRVGPSSGRFGAVVLRWLPAELTADQQSAAFLLRPVCGARGGQRTPRPVFRVEDSILWGNRGVRGGALAVLYAQRVTTYGSYSPLEVLPEFVISDSNVTNNTAVTEGGAIYMSAVHTVYALNGVASYSANVSLLRSVFSDNHAPDGGSDFVAAGELSELRVEGSLIRSEPVYIAERAVDLRGRFGLVIK